jgi:hypothetical protein
VEYVALVQSVYGREEDAMIKVYLRNQLFKLNRMDEFLEVTPSSAGIKTILQNVASPVMELLSVMFQTLI